MLLADFRRVLESEALSRVELVGFLTALFLEEDGVMCNPQAATEARDLIAALRPCDREAQAIWMSALDRMREIYKLP